MTKKIVVIGTAFASILVAVIYYIVILFLTENWHQPVLYNSIPDLIVFTICFVLIAIIHHLPSQPRKRYLIVGFVLHALVRLMRVPMSELYDTGRYFNDAYWFLNWIVYYVSVWFILIGFKKTYD